MPLYACKKCEYTTKLKQRFICHLSNKTFCRTQIIMVGDLNELNEVEQEHIQQLKSQLYEIKTLNHLGDFIN